LLALNTLPFAARCTHVAIASVQDEGYVAFSQTMTKLLRIAVAQAEVKHGR
jgi:hypothetical protein